MSYGLKITNPSGELVISSDANGLYCIGKAVLQGAVVQASGTATAATPGRSWGGSVYRIAHPGPIIAAIDLPLNKFTGVLGIAPAGVGLWDIFCYCGDTPDIYVFDTVQYQVDVWAYGFASTVLGSYGMALYNASGALAHDLSRPHPLYPRAFVNDVFNTPVTIPALTRPVVMGCPTSTRKTQDFVSTNHYASLDTRAVWRRTSSTSMTQLLRTRQRFEYSAAAPADDSSDDTGGTPCFILEGALLP